MEIRLCLTRQLDYGMSQSFVESYQQCWLCNVTNRALCRACHRNLFKLCHQCMLLVHVWGQYLPLQGTRIVAFELVNEQFRCGTTVVIAASLAGYSVYANSKAWLE